MDDSSRSDNLSLKKLGMILDHNSVLLVSPQSMNKDTFTFSEVRCKKYATIVESGSSMGSWVLSPLYSDIFVTIQEALIPALVVPVKGHQTLQWHPCECPQYINNVVSTLFEV